MVFIKDKRLDVSCEKWKAVHVDALNELVLKNGEDRVAALKRLSKWNGEAPVATLVAKVDCATQKVTATEYFTGGSIFPFDGKLESFANYKLNRAANPDLVGVRVSFTIRGEILRWLGCPAGKNTTGWISLANLDAGVRFHTKEGNELTMEGCRAAGLEPAEWLANAMLRLTLQHGGDAHTMRLSACALYNDGQWPGWLDIHHKPELVPGIVLKVKGQEHRHRTLTWLPMEQDEWAMGLARLPLLELAADLQEVDLDHFPSRGDVGKAIFGHFRAVTKVTHAKDRADLTGRLAAGEGRAPNQKVDNVWPEEKLVRPVTGRIAALTFPPHSYFLADPAQRSGTEPCAGGWRFVA